MADLFWPGDERAGDTFDQQSFLLAMIDVEMAWLRASDPAAPTPSSGAVTADVIDDIASAAEAGGNPVQPVVRFLKQRIDPDRADSLHQGLTSQDVVDTALMLCARTAATRVVSHLDNVIDSLTELATMHRDDVMAGRTLTQYAVPITFGLKVSGWLRGVLDARSELRRLDFPVQIGGAAGTLAASVELAGGVPRVRKQITDASAFLGLVATAPWHTVRTPVTRYADALVSTTDALGHIARDVLSLARSEVAEVAESGPPGSGSSSTMPHKNNPVLAVLVRRAALAGPGTAAQLHLASADAVDERSDGGWHLEWATLSMLSRRTVVAASQVADLVGGLNVDTAVMAARAEATAQDLLAEQRRVRDLTGRGADGTPDARGYLGAAGALVDETLERARTALKEDS
jgi:3-carboxy-cis,cis-muconate cycloisomerase